MMLRAIPVFFIFMLCAPNAQAIEFGVGVSKLLGFSNNGEFFKKETEPPAALDFFIESSKHFSPFFHVLLLDSSANVTALSVVGFKYKFGGSDSAHLNSLGGAVGLNLWWPSLSAELRFESQPMIFSAYGEALFWGDQGYGSYGFRVGRMYPIHGW